MDVNQNAPSFQVFKRIAEMEAKKRAKTKIKEQNPNLKFSKVEVTLKDKQEDEKGCYTLIYDCKTLAKETGIIHSVTVIVKEKNLSKGRYCNLAIDYVYKIYNWTTTDNHKTMIGRIGSYSKNKGELETYFALKYYFEVLNTPKKDIGNEDSKVDYKGITGYLAQAQCYYAFGKQWFDFSKFLIEFLKIKKTTQLEKVASQVYSFYKAYHYSIEDMELGLKYFYDYLEKPIPDSPSIGILPHILADAKQKLKEEQDRKELMDYIIDLFHLDSQKSYPLIQAEIRKFKSKEYGDLTYKGMKSTLDYYYNLLQNPLPKVPNISIIPYKYNEALKFYTQRHEVKENGGLPNTVPVINVFVDSEARKRNNEYYENRYINQKNLQPISEIEVDENEIFDRI